MQNCLLKASLRAKKGILLLSLLEENAGKHVRLITIAGAQKKNVDAMMFVDYPVSIQVSLILLTFRASSLLFRALLVVFLCFPANNCLLIRFKLQFSTLNWMLPITLKMVMKKQTQP